MTTFERIINEGDWTLFIDRDGTINKRLPGRYVTKWEEFQFLSGALEALQFFSGVFQHIIVVTNQQGIGKEIMTAEELHLVHQKMSEEVVRNGGYIDQIYYCPHLAVHDPTCRKPNPGMAIQAASDFENIVFKKSLMVGDMISDMQFGHRLDMRNVLVGNNHEQITLAQSEIILHQYASIHELATYLRNI